MKQPLLIPWAHIDDGALVEVEAAVDGAPESLIVHRRGDAAHAWLNICPHAGRRLDWAPGRFLVSKGGDLVCAAHGAAFALPSGECISGPCRGQHLRSVELVTDAEGIRLGAPGDAGGSEQ
jgi:nitrite reductase/ring-hydroxylating ferredoxin subunit